MLILQQPSDAWPARCPFTQPLVKARIYFGLITSKQQHVIFLMARAVRVACVNITHILEFLPIYEQFPIVVKRFLRNDTGAPPYLVQVQVLPLMSQFWLPMTVHCFSCKRKDLFQTRVADRTSRTLIKSSMRHAI